LQSFHVYQMTTGAGFDGDEDVNRMMNVWWVNVWDKKHFIMLEWEIILWSHMNVSCVFSGSCTEKNPCQLSLWMLKRQRISWFKLITHNTQMEWQEVLSLKRAVDPILNNFSNWMFF
jgi:hypothetical protein